MIDRSQEEIMKNWPKDLDTPLVSIRSLVYNQEKYIAQALDGFLMQQTNFPFEIVVHDDASTDKTANIIRDYEAKYPQIIKPIYETENQYSKHDGSLSRAINSGCRGKYIALCEGDDYWTDAFKLQKQLDFLKEHPDYSMCFHRAKIKYEKGYGDCALKCDDIENREYKPDEFLTKWIAPTASIMSKRECLFYEIKNLTHVLNGDVFFILKCSALGKIYGMSDYMSVYRVHEGGVTYHPSIQRERTMKYPLHFECILENFPNAAPKYIKRKIAETYFDRAKIQPSVKEAFKDYAKAFAASRRIFFRMTKNSIKSNVKKLFV